MLCASSVVVVVVVVVVVAAVVAVVVVVGGGVDVSTLSLGRNTLGGSRVEVAGGEG